MPPKSERAQNLVTFASDELQKLKRGEVERLSSTSVLARQFGYKRATSVSNLLRRGVPDVNKERIESEKPWGKDHDIPSPSIELAWLMGAFCGSGHSDQRYAQAQFASTDSVFAEKFSSTSQQLFNIPTFVNKRQRSDNEAPMHWVVLNRRGIVEYFGEISRDVWPETLREKHSWILSQEDYIGGFLAGFFDARGDPALPRSGTGGQIAIGTSYVEVANFLLDLLDRLNIKANLARMSAGREGISGIRITKYSEIKKFALYVHSVIPEKEQKLAFYRDFKPEITRTRPTGIEEIIEDYRQARDITVGQKGKLPSQGDIRRLREEGRIKFSGGVYSDYFGDGSFIAGRSQLESILRERNIVDSKEVPTPRPLSYNDQDLIEEYRRLREIIYRRKGKLPTQRDINDLKKRGETQYTWYPFATHFGGELSSFRVAISYLEWLIGHADAGRKDEKIVFP